MKKGIVGMIAVVGLAAAANAQQPATWLLEVEYEGGHSAIGPGMASFATVRLGVEWDPEFLHQPNNLPYVAFAGSEVDIVASESGFAGSGVALEPSGKQPSGALLDPATGVTYSGDKLAFAPFGQLWFNSPPVVFIPSMDNPIWIFEVEWSTASFAERDVVVTTENSPGFQLYLEAVLPTGGPAVRVDADHARGIIRVIPTPSSLALLSLGGLVALRRRR